MNKNIETIEVKKSIKQKIKKIAKLSLKVALIQLLTFSVLSIIVYNIPLKADTYKLTKDGKTIIFQEMVHIADSSFYNSVNADIINYKSSGYTLFYEMIKVNNKEEINKISALIGLESKAFQDIVNATNLDNQKDFMLEHDKNDVHADIDSKQLIDRLENHYKKNEITKSVVDINSFDVNCYLPKSEKAREIISRNFIKIGLWVNYLFRIDPTNSNEVIINERNDILIEKINQSKKDKIYVQYGAFHFEDFKEKLEKEGYKSEVIDTKVVFE